MEYVKLKDVANILNGYAFKSKLYVNSGIRVIRIANVQDGYISDENPCFYPDGAFDEISRYILKDGDLLISLTGNVGRVGILPTEYLPAALNQRVSCIRIKQDANLSLSFLYYYLLRKQFMRDCIKSSKGVAQLNLSTKWLENYLIPAFNLETQKKIVSDIDDRLSQLDSAVATLNKTKQQLEIYRQAVLKEAFSGTLCMNRIVQTNLPCLVEEEKKDLPPIPNEWKYVKLSSLGELARGKSKHRPRNDKVLFENGKYPFIQTGDVKNAEKYITNYSSLYGDFGLQQSKLWKKGTLCITIAANIAETAFLGMDACFPDSIVGFLPSENVISDYVRYFIETQKSRLWAFAPATAQKNINLKTLENLVVPYCSIEEQKDIITVVEEKLSRCSSIEKTINQSLQQAESLRQSILKKAFEDS